MEPPGLLSLDPDKARVSPALGRDIVLIDRLLGQVVAAQHGAELVELARRLLRDDGDPATLLERLPELRDAATARRVLRAYTVLFQLLNTAELLEIVRVNRERERKAFSAICARGPSTRPPAGWARQPDPGWAM